jgi:hypothetical protein
LGETDINLIPKNIILDRLYVHAGPNTEMRRCISLNGAYTAVVDSYIAGCKYQGGDAQAILVINTPGPIKIVNNYLEGSGENVMFGGGDPKIQGMIPSDIEIRQNHFFKPMSWQGQYTVKNLLEFKMGRRILVEGNVFENNWQAAQSGYAINIKSANQGGGYGDWTVTEHVTFRYNIIRNSSQGITLFVGRTDSQPFNTILIAHNIMDRIGADSDFGGQGKILQIVGGVDNIIFEHNTMFGQRLTGFTGTKGQVDNFVFRNNIVSGGRYGLTGDGTGEGTATLNTFATGGWAMDGNLVIGRNGSSYPANNHFPNDVGAIGFRNYGAGDYELSSTSMFKGLLSGTDPGAAIAQVMAATAGVN